MLNPIEQSPALAYEPARQQILHQPQAEGAAAVTPTQAAALSTSGQVQQSAESGANGGATGNQDDSGDGASGQPHSSAAQRLGAAWSTLSQLKHQASAALSSGNVSTARELASEAASIAGSIRDLVSSAGAAGMAGADSALQEADAVSADAPVGLSASAASASTTSALAASASIGPSSTETASMGQSQGASPLDLARAGLNAAQDVIATSLQQTALTSEERSALISQQQMVGSAMVTVETVAAQQTADSPLLSQYAAHALVDVKA